MGALSKFVSGIKSSDSFSLDRLPPELTVWHDEWFMFTNVALVLVGYPFGVRSELECELYALATISSQGVGLILNPLVIECSVECGVWGVGRNHILSGLPILNLLGNNVFAVVSPNLVLTSFDGFELDYVPWFSTVDGELLASDTVSSWFLTFSTFISTWGRVNAELPRLDVLGLTNEKIESNNFIVVHHEVIKLQELNFCHEFPFEHWINVVLGGSFGEFISSLIIDD